MSKLKRLIKAHVNAQIELSWIGSRDAEEHEEIRSAAKRAQKALNDYLKTMEPAKQVVYDGDPRSCGRD